MMAGIFPLTGLPIYGCWGGVLLKQVLSEAVDSIEVFIEQCAALPWPLDNGGSPSNKLQHLPVALSVEPSSTPFIGVRHSTAWSNISQNIPGPFPFCQIHPLPGSLSTTSRAREPWTCHPLLPYFCL